MIITFLIRTICHDLNEVRNKELQERSVGSGKKAQGQTGLCSEMTTLALNEEKTKIRDEKNYPEVTNNTSPGLVNKTYKDNQQFRLPAEVKFDYEVHNFKDSGIGESLMLGNDSDDYANAYIGGYTKCPENITVPRSLMSREGVTKPVEVIGRYAYYGCGHLNWGPKTKTVLVTKQVKIIKYCGFGNMYNVQSFRIEEGSVLQSIENRGLHAIGWDTGQYDSSKRGTLTLPSTLSSVAYDGFYQCNLFKIFIYCGTHFLPEECELEWSFDDTIEKTKVKVTDKYSASTIFGRIPFRDSSSEVQSNCRKMEIRPTPTSSRSISPSRSVSRSHSRSRSVSPSRSHSRSASPTPSCNCPRTPLRKITLSLAALFFALLPSNSISSSISASSSSTTSSETHKFTASFSVSFPSLKLPWF